VLWRNSASKLVLMFFQNTLKFERGFTHWVGCSEVVSSPLKIARKYAESFDNV